MALSKTIQTNFGFEIQNAYHRVSSVTIKNKTSMDVEVSIYADTDSKPVSVKGYLADYDLSSSNPIAQAYEYLKTLPEFDSATDV
jgi:hypothetical protein